MRLRYWAIFIFLAPYLAVPVFLYRHQRYQRLLAKELHGNEKNLAIFGIIWLPIILLTYAITPAGYEPANNRTMQTTATLTAVNALTIGEPFQYNSFEVTITDVKIQSGIRKRETYEVGDKIYEDTASSKQAQYGAKFVVFHMSAKNNGKTPARFEPSIDYAVDSLERKYRIEYNGGINKYKEIAPGLTSDNIGYYVEVPDETDKLSIEFWSGGLFSTEFVGRIDFNTTEPAN